MDGNKPRTHGITPLLVAIEKGNTPVVRALLQSGKVDPNRPMADGTSPMFLATYLGRDAEVASRVVFAFFTVFWFVST